jgi:hypothetical protein
MKYLKFWCFLFLVAVIGCFTLAGCKPDPDLDPWVGTADIGTGKTMTVKWSNNATYVPENWDHLKTALEAFASDFTNNGNYVLTIAPGSTEGFTTPNPGDKKATVGELFIQGKSSGQIGSGINVILHTWIQ